MRKKRNAVLFGLEEANENLAAVWNLVSTTNPHEEHLKVQPTDISCVFRDGPRLPGQAPLFFKVVCVTSAVQRSFIWVGEQSDQTNKSKYVCTAGSDIWAKESRPCTTQRMQKFGTHKFFIDYNEQIIVNKTDRKMFSDWLEVHAALEITRAKSRGKKNLLFNSRSTDL